MNIRTDFADIVPTDDKKYTMREFATKLAPMIDKTPEGTRGILRQFKKNGSLVPLASNGYRKADVYSESQIEKFMTLFQSAKHRTSTKKTSANVVPLFVDNAPTVEDTTTIVEDTHTDAAQVETPTTTDKKKRIDEATKFFNQLYGQIPAPHFVYLIKFTGGIETYSFTVNDATQLAAMAKKAVELADSGVDIWHSVNPVCIKPHYEFDEDTKKEVLKRGDEGVVSYQTALICDIDIQSDAHKSDNLVATFDEARACLPFKPSLLVDSGFGLHAYYIFDTPLAITEDNREEIKRRNKLLLDVIRAKANGKTIDPVDDLPRILRTPATFNYKLGKDNASLCHVVEDTGLRFTLTDLDERLNAFNIAPTPKPARTLDITYDDDTDLKKFRIRRMLDDIYVVDGEYEKWFNVGTALYNEFGGSNEGLALWEQWSSTQPEYTPDKTGYSCSDKWKTFHYDPNGNGIGTLYQYATEGGYDEKETQREYYQLYPEKLKLRNSNGSAQIKDLQKELTDINNQLADFDKEKSEALESIRNLQKFGYEDVTADAVITAVGFARCFEKSLYTTLRADIKAYRKEHKEGKEVDLNDYGATTKELAEIVQARYDKLLARRNELQAAVRTQKFIAANQDDLAGYIIPDGYSVSATGIEKISGKRNETVCRRPVIISGRVFDTDNKNYSLTLCYKNAEGKWKEIKAQKNSVVFNARRIVDLADANLPVTSQNAGALVEFLDAFRAENESRLPMTYEVARCGWYEFDGQKVFIDPRRDCDIEVDGKKIHIAIDDNSEFAKHLKTKGSLKAWKRAYQLAKKSPVARFIVAASVAPPLLEVLGERNFMLYVKSRTRAGKTTALMLGASAIGDEKTIRSFDATKNGLVGAAADVNDYAFFVDEKQVADNRLKENLADLVYAFSNGIGRTKLNKDSTLKKLLDWRGIAIGTGETDILPENATDGANTRLLPPHAPDVILPADDCRQIRDIIKENYGHALPLVIDEIKTIGKDKLLEVYNDLCETFEQKYEKILPEYRRYVAIVTIADTLLNSVLFGNAVTTEDGENVKPIDDATLNAYEILDDIPTTEEISATDREKDFVRGFVGENQPCFEGGSKESEHMIAFYGKLNDPHFIYITVKALKDACNRAGFDYRKLVADLIADGFFTPGDTIKKGCKKPLATVQKKIGSLNADCYRIAKSTFDGVR